MTSVLVVIPTYNESESIESLLKRLNSARMQISDRYEIDILIVDDNSPDQTAVIAKNLQLSGLKVLSRQHKSGLGPAYLAGFKQGLLEKYDYFVEMDAKILLFHDNNLDHRYQGSKDEVLRSSLVVVVLTDQIFQKSI